VGKIRTVLGDIHPSSLGLTLSHEHVMCDFVGARSVDRSRYDRREVVRTMLPYLLEIRQLGVTGFVDCTPAFIGRDPIVLAELSKAAGIHILMNTGLYKEPYLPDYAYERSADELAAMWVAEIEEGVEDEIVRARTGRVERFPVKAGFVKIAVNPGPIEPVQEKIVRAAARCSQFTGAAVVCHTGHPVAVLELLRVVKEERLEPDRLVVAHLDAVDDRSVHAKVLEWGAWASYDGVGESTAERTLKLLELALAEGFEDQVLLSQDAGWYNVGEPGGGRIRGYSYLVKVFSHLIEEKFGKSLAEKLLVRNPARAFEMK
jgi:phosphotriesterase-related protein